MNKIYFLLIILFLNLSFPFNGISQLIPTAKLNNTKTIQWSKKISPLLKIQLDVKMSSQQGLHKTSLNKFKNLGLRTENPEYHLIYLYLKEFPSASQISDVENMGGIVYTDSWIPPVGAHPMGFLLAQVPLNTINNLAQFEDVKKIDTAEKNFYPKNDNAVSNINANDAWGAGFKGTGVVVGVFDSGLDSLMADLPVLTASRDYSAWPSFDDGIENTVTGHGTHVTGSVLGRGTLSGGTYKGVAPEADLVFLKIGNDASGSASSAAIVNAIQDAVDVYNVDIITMSYGGWDTYHDGTAEEDQAVDYAVSQGVPVFISAGNEANDDLHYSGTVLANDSTNFIPVNVSVADSNTTALIFNLVWCDGLGTNNVLDVNYYNNSLNGLPRYVPYDQSESDRGTESEVSGYSYYLLPGINTLYIKIINSSGSDQDFHLYYYDGFNPANTGSVTFQNADPYYTLGSPATADGAIAVGAHVSRHSWTDFEGNPPWTFGEALNDIATFSSRGPRVDGVQKITLTAPGSAIISLRDSTVVGMSGALVIDNDGINDGFGPANYIIMQGTSMACPIAAGAAALLLNQDPTLTPSQIRDLLINNTTVDGYTGSVPNDTWGYGKLNIEQALGANLPGTIYTETVNATGSYNFNDIDISMNFSTNGTNGDVTATEIYNSPVGGTTNVTGGLDHVSEIIYWKINTAKTGYNTSITFSYYPIIDGIGDESKLLLATRDYNEDTWTEYADISRDPGNDQITANNVTSSSQWIFAAADGDNPLPVELTSFTSQVTESGVELSWKTASEINNLGFTVFRKTNNSDLWQEVSNYDSNERLKGAGSTASGAEYNFNDYDVQPRTLYSYKIADVDYIGNKQYSHEVEINTADILNAKIPETFTLKNAYPNPFNPFVTISYGLPEAANVKIDIFNITGKKVKTLINKTMQAGWHKTKWNGQNSFDRQIGSGVYFYVLKTGENLEIRKIVMIK